MGSTDRADLDVLIFGGGVGGLWLLDHLRRGGYRVLLLEAGALGSGQTAASQGIVHGGLKYSLRGLLTPSARAVRDMPALWRRCLEGRAAPDLRNTLRRAEHCHLWQTRALSSRFAMVGARAGLRVVPEKLPHDARPEALAACPGTVARLDEQVIEPASLIADLADQHRQLILSIDPEAVLDFAVPAAGSVDLLRLTDPATGARLELRPHWVVFTAGTGNADLRRRVRLNPKLMQRRGLHMVLARGDLPVLNGHCVDGMHTRATITTARDGVGRTVWQIGGQIAEDGVRMQPDQLIGHAVDELRGMLPGIDPGCASWATCRVDRAEGLTKHGLRPAGVVVSREGNTITAWPTKMVLAPVMAEQIRRLLPDPKATAPPPQDIIDSWPRPDVARPPWEEALPWTAVD